MYRRVLNWGMAAICLSASGLGLTAEANGPLGEADAVTILRPGRNLDMAKIHAEPLSETLREIHEFWWGPLELPPWDPYRYVNSILELSRMKKLMHIVDDGSEAERAELLKAANAWLDRYLNDYPTVNYLGYTEGHAGFSVLHPGMDVALTLVLADLDPSRETLERISKAFDAHVTALHHSHKRNNVRKSPDDDGVARSQTSHVFGVAAVRLVENAKKLGEAWLMDDENLLSKYEAALEIALKNDRMLHDYVAIVDVTRSEMAAKGEIE